MKQVSEPFDLALFDQASAAVLTKLRTAYDDAYLDLEDRTFIANSNAEKVQDLQAQLENEWQRLLTTERDTNSESSYLSSQERRRRERDLFTRALDLLPRARNLVEIETLIAHLRDQAPTQSQGSVDAGLQALQAQDFHRALFLLAHAGDPGTVADEIQNQREDDADGLLQKARTAYAQAGSMPYDDVKREVQEQYLDPVWIIGREFHREMVQRFFEQIPTEKLEGTPLVPSDSVIPEEAPVSVLQEEAPLPLPPEEPLPIANPVGRNEKRAFLMLGGGALFLLLIVGSALAFAQGSGSPPQPATTTAGAGVATAQTGTAAAVAVNTTRTSLVTVSPVRTPTVKPTVTLAPITITSVEPTAAFTGTLPITFTVSVKNLNEVQTARLVAPGRKPIQLTIRGSDAPDELILVLATLPEPLNGEVTYKLQIDGEEYAEIKLRDYIEIKNVKGVKSEYTYTGRVADDNGPFTGMRVVRDVASERTGTLRNDDQIEILRDEGDGWYLVRIHTSSDPNQIGVEGWIERWLVDDKADEVPTPVPTSPPPPPTNTPRPISVDPLPPPQPSERYFSAGSIVSYDGTGDSGGYESCVTGSVSGSEGPIIGATVNVNDGPVNSYTVTTGGGGYFRVCGLGANYWTAVLYFVPGTPTGNQPAVTVYVNGLPAQHAVVSFTQQ